MSIYLNIIKLLFNKELYSRYYKYIDLLYLKQNFPELWRVFLTLPKMFELLKGSHATLSDLEVAYQTAYPSADKVIFAALLAQIEAAEADPALIEEYLRSLASRQMASELAFSALDYAEGKKTEAAFSEEMLRFRELEHEPVLLKDKYKFVTDNIEEIWNETIHSPGLSWRLKSLRRSLGPLRKGDFGFLFARPETGKTTFLASEVSYMAEQSDRPVLWFNNEQKGDLVKARIQQASLGATSEQINRNRRKAQEAYDKRIGGRILLLDDATISRRSIEELCRLYSPALIVVDQLDKVKGFEADREDLMLGDIYIWAREIAKEYAPFIGVSQSDGSGEGQKWLNMGNVSNAKTAKQAEADWILGIGLDYNDPPNIRGFSVCKNKLSGGEESIPALRHGKWQVLIQPEIGRYEDLHE